MQKECPQLKKAEFSKFNFSEKHMLQISGSLKNSSNSCETLYLQTSLFLSKKDFR